MTIIIRRPFPMKPRLRPTLATLAILLAPFSPACSTLLTEVSAEDVVKQLWLERVPVCFERVFNKATDAMTLGAAISALERIPKGQRSDAANERLQMLLRLKKQGTAGKSIIDWKQTRFDFDFPGPPSDPAKVLDALVKADPAYTWEKLGTRYLVYPKENSFNKPIGAFQADKLKFQDFIGAGSRQIFEPSGLNYMVVIMGQPWFRGYEEKVYSLTFPAMDSRIALTRFVDAIGPDIVWQVMGGEAFGRNLSFWPLPKREAASLPP